MMAEVITTRVMMTTGVTMAAINVRNQRGHVVIGQMVIAGLNVVEDLTAIAVRIMTVVGTMNARTDAALKTIVNLEATKIDAIVTARNVKVDDRSPEIDLFLGQVSEDSAIADSAAVDSVAEARSAVDLEVEEASAPARCRLVDQTGSLIRMESMNQANQTVISRTQASHRCCIDRMLATMGRITMGRIISMDRAPHQFTGWLDGLVSLCVYMPQEVLPES